MKISIKWVAKYVPLDDFLADPETGGTKLSDILTNGGLEVEGIFNQAASLKHVVVAEILEKNKHPNADNLTLCRVTTGDKEHRIVCGAKNHNAGDKVVLALPGAVLPGDFAIKVSKIRGEESQGMLCSEKELGLKNESEGIMILPANAPVGQSFSKYQKLDDIVLDIKVTPNRSDCLSHLGIARELAGLLGRNFEFPSSPLHEGRESTRKLVKVVIEDGERCPRYAGRVVQNLKIGPSPDWLVQYLEAIGLRSINNVVDITNFVMMEVGQPLHAFDLEKIQGSQIFVRKAKPTEPIEILDGRELELEGSELVICDEKRPIALAGVMGGLDSGVSDTTKSVFVESAYFMPSAIRRASRRHGIDTDSSYRFSRGVDPEGVLTALNRACQLLSEIAGGTVCADSYDIYPRPVVRPRIEVDLKFVSARLGVTFESAESKRLLERIGCEVTGSGGKLMVKTPAYRSDLRIQEDLAEELIRLKGFDSVPETLPAASAEPTRDKGYFNLEFRLCRTLQGLGLNQAVNLSLTSYETEEKFLTSSRGEPLELGVLYDVAAVKIKNPLNNELNSLRRSLIPSLVKNAEYNVRHNLKSGGIFEIAPVFYEHESDDLRGKRPFTEKTFAALALWGLQKESWIKPSEVPVFFRLKGIVEEWLRQWAYRNVRFEAPKSIPGFLHPGQTCRLVVEGKPVGWLGALHPAHQDEKGFAHPVALAEVSLDLLFHGQPKNLRYKAISKFPSVQRDVAFLAPEELAASAIAQELLRSSGPLSVDCELFDVFSGSSLPSGKKSLAYRVTYQDEKRTLSDDEVNSLHQKAVSAVCQKLSLSVR